MPYASITITSTLLATLLALTTSCSSALTLSGDLDGEPVPVGFSGAMAEVEISGQELLFGVWSTLGDTCALGGLLIDEINDSDDRDQTDDSIEGFFRDIPGDFWLMTTFFTDAGGGSIGGEEDFKDLNMGGFLCHFTDGPDLSDTPETACAAFDPSTADASLNVVEGNSLSFSGELELFQQDNNGRRRGAGELSGHGVAAACPALADALERFFRDCNSSGGERCQAAQTAFLGSHTIQR